MNHLGAILEHVRHEYLALRSVGADHEAAVFEACDNVLGSIGQTFDEALDIFNSDREAFREVGGVEYLHVSQLNNPASPDVVFVASVADCLFRIIEDYLNQLGMDEPELAGRIRAVIRIRGGSLEILKWG